jgi:hypothetical protein
VTAASLSLEITTRIHESQVVGLRTEITSSDFVFKTDKMLGVKDVEGSMMLTWGKSFCLSFLLVALLISTTVNGENNDYSKQKYQVARVFS